MMAELRRLARIDALLAWYGALGAASAWAIHLVVVYAWNEAACSTGTAEEATEPLVLGVTGGLGAASLASGLAAFLTWRRARSGAVPDPRGRIVFLGLAGMIAAVVFTFATILEGVHVLFLPPCDPG